MTPHFAWLAAPPSGWQLVGLAAGGLALIIIGYLAGARLRRKRIASAGLRPELFRACLEQVRQGVAVLQPPRDTRSVSDFVLQYINQAGCALNQLDREHVTGTRLANVRGALLNAELAPWLQFVHSTGKPLRTAVSLSQESSTCDLEYEFRAIRVGRSLVLIWSDVTGRTQAEAAYQDLFDRVPVGLYRTTPSGTIVAVNPALVKLLGFPNVAAVRAKNAIDFYVDQQARSQTRSALDRDGVLVGAQLQLRRSDGKAIWVRDTSRAVRDGQGAVQYYEGVMEDITEQYVALAALQESEARHRELVENSHEMIYSMDLAGNLLAVNQAAERILGYERNERAGVNIRDVVRPEYQQLVRDAIDAIAGGARGERYEVEVSSKSGRRIWLETSMRLRFHDGQPVGIEGIAWDITERKRSEEQLEAQRRELARSNAELEHFAYVASHDLQEPLRMVASFAELLGDRYRGKLDADADEFIGYMVDGARRMQRMIKDLLAYSRIATRGHELRPTDSQEVLNRVLENLRLRIQESGAIITHNRLPWVLADASQLEQVFQNLLSNAIKFRDSDAPAIVIEAERAGEEWVFTIRDNGLGVSAEDLDRIFMIFERGQHNRPGTGIGLAICKRVTERHGGRIWVEPRPGARRGLSLHNTRSKERRTCKTRPVRGKY